MRKSLNLNVPNWRRFSCDVWYIPSTHGKGNQAEYFHFLKRSSSFQDELNYFNSYTIVRMYESRFAIRATWCTYKYFRNKVGDESGSQTMSLSHSSNAVIDSYYERVPTSSKCLLPMMISCFELSRFIGELRGYTSMRFEF